MTYENAQIKLDKLKISLAGIWEEDYIISLHLLVAPKDEKQQNDFIYNFHHFRDGLRIALSQVTTKNFDVYGYKYIPKEGGVDLIINYDFVEIGNQ